MSGTRAFLGALLAVIVAGASGCGSDSDSGGGGNSAEWQAYCSAVVAREEQCDPGNPPSPSLAECNGAESCFGAIVRSTAQKPLRDCLSQRPCTKSDDDCFLEVAQAVGEGAGQADYAAKCASKMSACGAGSGNDWCTDGDIPWKLFPADVYAELGACFDGSCADLDACMGAALEKRVTPCGGQAGL